MLTEAQAKQYAKTQPDVLQFKRSLDHIQGSTGMTLKNLHPALEALAAILYAEGWRDALKDSHHGQQRPAMEAKK